jgi:hypothetical protein
LQRAMLSKGRSKVASSKSREVVYQSPLIRGGSSVW